MYYVNTRQKGASIVQAFVHLSENYISSKNFKYIYIIQNVKYIQYVLNLTNKLKFNTNGPFLSLFPHNIAFSFYL